MANDPPRPVFHEEMGKYFLKLRIARGWVEQSHAAHIAKTRGFRRVTRQVLIRLEAGRTKCPDPAVLKEIAELYECRYEELVAEVARHLYGATLQPANFDLSEIVSIRAELATERELRLAAEQRLARIVAITDESPPRGETSVA